MDDIDQRLRRVEAEAAIVPLKSQYARFADDGYNPDGLAGLFTEDGCGTEATSSARVQAWMPSASTSRRPRSGSPGRSTTS